MSALWFSSSTCSRCVGSVGAVFLFKPCSRCVGSVGAVVLLKHLQQVCGSCRRCGSLQAPAAGVWVMSAVRFSSSTCSRCVGSVGALISSSTCSRFVDRVGDAVLFKHLQPVCVWVVSTIWFSFKYVQQVCRQCRGALHVDICV